MLFNWEALHYQALKEQEATEKTKQQVALRFDHPAESAAP
jgi:hypothetical protein